MPKFFVDSIDDDFLTIKGETARHISRSLRMRVGDILLVTDGSGTDCGCSIESIDGSEVHLKICYRQPSESEPTVQVTLYQGMPKGDKMDDIIQKAVELGVTKIVPVLTKRSVSRPDAKSAKKKQERYQKIALEAAQQSGRGIIPQVANMMNFETALQNAKEDKLILFYEGGGIPLRELVGECSDDVNSYGVFIGPEGGFEPAEAEAAQKAGCTAATLGKRILRTQTAPAAALSAIMLLTGNLE